MLTKQPVNYHHSTINLASSPSKFSVPPPSFHKDEDKSKFLRQVLETDTPQRILVNQLAHAHIEEDVQPEVLFFSLLLTPLTREELPALFDSGPHGRRVTPTFPVSEELQLKVYFIFSFMSSHFPAR